MKKPLAVADDEIIVIPTVIYLQVQGHPDISDFTWCRDRIHESDAEYRKVVAGDKEKDVNSLTRTAQSGERFLTAVDAEGFHFRKTLCVTHDVGTGTATYDARPIVSASSLIEGLNQYVRLMQEWVK